MKTKTPTPTEKPMADRRDHSFARFIFIDLVDLWHRFIRPFLGGRRG